MTKKTLTPDAVKKIESALEERKPKAERRQKSDAAPGGQERRTGKDRRAQD